MTKEQARSRSQKYIIFAEKIENKIKDLEKSFSLRYQGFDWTQPVLLGHHSQSRHEKDIKNRDSFFKKIALLNQKKKRLKEKAENLKTFAETNKGDAENRRQTLRSIADQSIGIGTKVFDPCYREGVVVKVNTKTYTIQFAPDFICPRDKSFVRKLS